MGNTKTTFRFFTIAQYRQEEEYLSSMHEKGWKLYDINFPGFYHFEKCIPEKVSYRLDYNKEGIRNRSEYIQMFSDCGWTYLLDFVGYSYFCKEGDASEEIFCDEESRLEMMKRVFRGRIIPLIIIFALVLMPQLFMNMSRSGGMRTVLTILFLAIAVLYLVIFGVTAYQFYKYEKKLYPDRKGIKLKYFGTTALLVAVAAGIGIFSYFSLRSVYTVTDTELGFVVEAEQLNRSVVKTYDLQQGDIVEFFTKADKGTVNISVGEDKNTLIFSKDIGQVFFDGPAIDTVDITESGEYEIRVSGNRAEGNVEVIIR